MRNVRWSFIVGVAFLLMPLGALATPQPRLQQIDVAAYPIQLISRTSDGEAAEWSGRPSISADGRYVAFQSQISLVPADTNADFATDDIYVYDRVTGTLEFIGIPDASPETEYTQEAVISGDGRFVVFSSNAPDFVPDDENEVRDIFLYERATGSYTRLNLDVNGNQADAAASQPAISHDGRYVAFKTTAALLPDDTNELDDVYVVDRIEGTLERIGGGDGASGAPSLSGDGRYVAFESEASDLVPGDTNTATDIFVFDRVSGEIARVSVTTTGDEGDAKSASPTISTDGRYVVFLSQATNLALDDAGYWHVFVHDRQTRTTEQVDVSSDGQAANGDAVSQPAGISSDGRYVAFSSLATNLVQKDARNLVAPYDGAPFSDVLVRDRVLGTITLVSRTAAGLSGYGDSHSARISADGRFVAFASTADNLAFFDSSGDGFAPVFRMSDVFVRDMQAEFPPSPFELTRDRTDRPIAEGQATRTWIWAPEPLTPPFYEYYGLTDAENLLPYDLRAVQYFDKARMEISRPGEDPNSVWYVTNGLLVVEMMTGELQVDDVRRMQLAPAWVNVAGDAGDPNGPTYASLAGLRTAPPHPFGQPIVARVDRAGNVTNDPALASFGVQVAIVDDVTGHAIAAPFWEFMNSSGTVWDGAAFIHDLPFENPYFATGQPVTEAYWATVLVGGAPHSVLMQCFERRCLTYTPGNPEGFVVEAGNVGLHYYNWRYNVQPLAPDLSGPVVYTDGFHLNLLDHDGMRSVYSAPEGLQIGTPRWSPDGNQIAFSLSGSSGDIYVVNADGTDVRQLTVDGKSRFPSWSPDGARLVFESDSMVTIINSDGTGREELRPGWEPTWSPLGDRIAFVYVNEGSSWHYLKTMNLDGSDVQDVVNAPDDPRSGTATFSGYAWSPDGSRFAYAGARFPTGSYIPIYSLYVVNADGTGAQAIDVNGSAGPNPGWSPDGSQVTYSREHIVYMVDPHSSKVSGLLWDFSRLIQAYDWRE